MAEIQDFNVADASNTARWPENMPFANVNNAGRADEGILARWYKDTDASITASGSSNAFTITSNRTIAALFNNLVMAFTANHTVTGATTLNLNGLGAKSIKRQNGDALGSGDIVSGQPVVVFYKSSGDQWFMISAAAALNGNAATQAQMEAATSVVVPVTPGRQHFHPGSAKAWALIANSGTATLQAGYNVASVTDHGTGDVTVTFTTALQNANYVAFITLVTDVHGNLSPVASVDSKAAGSFRIKTGRATSSSDTTTVATDFGFMVVVFGDMP